jgi:hypothetical protein
VQACRRAGVPVALALVLIRDVDANDGGGQSVHEDSLPESIGHA